MHQFVVNLSKITKPTLIWAKDFNNKFITCIQEVESKIGLFLINRQVGSLSGEDEIELGELLKNKKYMLAAKEYKWCLKSSEMWIRKDDNNSQTFHEYASYRRIVNFM
jgi:hypothetical protein